MQPETAAFGYLRKRWFENSGSFVATFGYPRHAPGSTGERRSLTFLKYLVGIFVPNLWPRHVSDEPTRGCFRAGRKQAFQS